jgi:hypothetical protein
MHRKIATFRTVIASLLLTLCAGGCASLVTGGPLIRNPNDPTGQIVIQNRSSVPVRSVLISPCSASSYGLNRLSKGGSVPAGSSVSFTVSAGCWDVMAGNSNSAPRRRLQVAADAQAVYTIP